MVLIITKSLLIINFLIYSFDLSTISEPCRAAISKIEHVCLSIILHRGLMERLELAIIIDDRHREGAILSLAQYTCFYELRKQRCGCMTILFLLLQQLASLLQILKIGELLFNLLLLEQLLLLLELDLFPGTSPLRSSLQ